MLEQDAADHVAGAAAGEGHNRRDRPSRIVLGAGGNSGTADAAKAAPDGYTIVGSGSGPVAANVTLYRHLDYDPQKDLVTISPFASFTIVVVASSKLPVTSLQELIAYAKAHPGELNYGSVGIGSSQHSSRWRPAAPPISWPVQSSTK